MSFRFSSSGAEFPPLLLWFTIQPELAPEPESVLHLRIARASLKALPWLTDALFKLVDELPLLEDADMVRQVDARAWSSNALGPKDAFLRQYRDAMLAHFLPVLARYVR